MHKNFVGGFDC